MWVFSGASPSGLPPAFRPAQCASYLLLLAATMFGATISPNTAKLADAIKTGDKAVALGGT